MFKSNNWKKAAPKKVASKTSQMGFGADDYEDQGFGATVGNQIAASNKLRAKNAIKAANKALEAKAISQIRKALFLKKAENDKKIKLYQSVLEKQAREGVKKSQLAEEKLKQARIALNKQTLKEKAQTLGMIAEEDMFDVENEYDENEFSTPKSAFEAPSPVYIAIDERHLDTGTVTIAPPFSTRSYPAETDEGSLLTLRTLAPVKHVIVDAPKETSKAPAVVGALAGIGALYFFMKG